MKTKSLLITLIFLFPLVSIAQNLKSELNLSDVRSALKLSGLEIFKFDFDSAKPDYNLVIYIDEINKDSIINQKTSSFGSWKGELLKKEFDIITKKNNEKSPSCFIKLVHPNMQQSMPFDFSSEFNNEHVWMPIKQDEIIYDKKVPLLFYGMMWEDSYKGQKIYRFCLGEDITRKMDNKNLKKVEHMLLISYELKK